MKRCGRTAFDGKRVWRCLLAISHDGDCWAARWNVERPFWEGWEVDPEPEPVSFVFGEPPTPPAPEVDLPQLVQGTAPAKTEGVKRKRKNRKAVFAGVNDGVPSAARWSGRSVLRHRTLSEMDQDSSI